MSETSAEHRQASPQAVRCAIVTVSDTRTLETDRGGALIATLLEAAGHSVARREVVPDDPAPIRSLVQSLIAEGVDAVLITGGTGVAPRDQTFETISQLLTKTLPGYGELFRMLSFADIGAAAMLSRAIGGVVGGAGSGAGSPVVVLTMPGSPNAVQLAMEKLIVPELAHLVYEARK